MCYLQQILIQVFLQERLLWVFRSPDFLITGSTRSFRDQCYQRSSAVRSCFKPLFKLRTDKRLNSLWPRQPPAHFIASTLNANADVEKWAACVLQHSEFSQRIVCRWIPYKFKLIAIRQFANISQRRLQQRRQLSMPRSLLAGKRRHVTSK